MMATPWDRVTRGTKRLTNRDWQLLDAVGRELKITVKVIQGSWSKASASAGTHGGAGAFDLSVAGLTEEQQLAYVDHLRRWNVAAWLRSPKYGWTSTGAHIHGIVKDTPGLSPTAKQQVTSYNQGLNGLANKGKDPFARPKQRRFLLPGMYDPTIPKSMYVKLANLKYSLRNEDVNDLQRELKIARDGYYGPVTDNAVRAHQKRMGLRPDPQRKSYVGPKQAKALGLIVQT
jgi:Putative peptidoglycan binding domain